MAFSPLAHAQSANSGWSPCDVGLPLKESHAISSTCAIFTHPAVWDRPDGRKIDYFVRKLHRTHATHLKGQIWLIAGGPGVSGDGFISQALTFLDLFPDFEVYIPDHRGTGASTRLDCQLQADEWVGDDLENCVDSVRQQWGDDLVGFSVTNAARDLGAAIEATQKPDTKTFVFGVSYGTYYVQRFLQIYPHLVSGVILDSLILPQGPGSKLLFSEAGRDLAVQQLSLECDRDPKCAAQFDGPAWGKITELMKKLRGDRCASDPNVTQDAYRWFVNVAIEDPSLRPLVPILFKRTDRCNDDDKKFIEKIFRKVSGAMNAADFEIEMNAAPSISYILEQYVLASEMGADDPWPSAEQIRAREREFLFGNRGAERALETWKQFPRYPADKYFNAWAQTDLPMLMLNGTFDWQSPVALTRAYRDHFTAPHQSWVELPRVVHGTLDNSAVGGDANFSCAWEILRQFVADPTRALDVSCKEKILPLDFSGDNKELKDFLGVHKNLWGHESIN